MHSQRRVGSISDVALICGPGCVRIENIWTMSRAPARRAACSNTSLTNERSFVYCDVRHLGGMAVRLVAEFFPRGIEAGERDRDALSTGVVTGRVSDDQPPVIVLPRMRSQWNARVGFVCRPPARFVLQRAI